MSRTYNQQTENLSEKEINRFLYCLYAYIALLVVFIAVVISDATAQDINSLTPDASVSMELATKIEGFISQLEAIEKPSTDWPTIPAPDLDDLSDTKSGSGQELFIYSMMTAMVERADRENFYCQKQLDAGYSPCYFKTIKPRDYYSTKWLADYNALQVKNLENVARLARDYVKFEIWNTGSGLYNRWETWKVCEENFYSCNYENGILKAEIIKLQGIISDLINQIQVRNIPDFKDGANKGNLWKPIADPKAECRGGTTILLDQKYNAPSINLQLLDSSFQDLKEFIRRFKNLDDGRPRFCVSKAGAKFGAGPIYIKFSDLTFRVNNPANRED